MTESLQAKLVNSAQVLLPTEQVPTEAQIRDIIARLAPVVGADESVQAHAVAQLIAQRLVRMDRGFALVDQHVPWVNARRGEIDAFYWNRLRTLLQRDGWPGGVLRGLDRSTDDVLDLLGNPAEQGSWKRRGLVMGDVQSGKTGTYSALICKAADAGYRFIVLLTGTIENLRRQTQERLDHAFVGRVSSELLKKNRRDIRVGVGEIDGRRNAVVFTSNASDFRAATADTVGVALNALNEPALVVIKKHAKILANLRDWVRANNLHAGSPTLDTPMLLIDDEADNASINVNDEDTDPTRVNAGIREVLKLFRRSAYVGFTATPFANIFVNPDGESEMLGDDLFPRDFIYTLQAPTNYFGPRRVFAGDAAKNPFLRTLTDVEAVLPARHRATHVVTELPPSLLDALAVFLVSNALRDLRGHARTHRSMLVNVSHFTNVQDQVEARLNAELERIRNDVRNFSALPTEEALKNASLRRLHDAWQREFSACEFDWPTVQSALRDAISPVTTVAVNQRTGSRALNYRAHQDLGLRVVAVGGNSLSRGLTLEGLSVSYFRRTSRMYDTLLQMGRWFGYRTGYEDLCRVWLPQIAIDWYGHISEATDELRSELRRMYDLGRTPKDFGLAVRAHPDSLMVTARNKMRNAQDITRVISVNAASFESVELPLQGRALQSNWGAATSFVELARRAGSVSEETPGGYAMLRNVPCRLVADLLRAFRLPPTEFRFQPDAIADLLAGGAAGSCELWDVVIPSGDGDPVTFAGRTFKALTRKVTREEELGLFVVSGQNRRVGSRGIEKAGLSPKEVQRAEARALEAEEKAATNENREPRTLRELQISDRWYREARSRPLLILHVLEVYEGEENAPFPFIVAPGEAPPEGVVALGLSFPRLPDGGELVRARYRINVVKARELFSGAGEGDDVTEEVQP